MSGKLNTTEAIKILSREGYIVEKVGKKFRLKWPCSPDHPRMVWVGKKLKDLNNNDLISGRELIKKARCYTSENNQTTKMKSNIKHFDKRVNRAKTRDLINSGDYDSIPLNDKAAEENPWNWD